MADGSVRKVVVHRPGAYDQLRVEVAEEPLAPGPGELTIEVAWAGVNMADCFVRMGLYASAKVFVGWPITPGFEVAGRVAAVGAGVTSLRPGDDVMAVTRFGGYASRVCLPAGQARRVPPGLTLAQAAALPAVGLTAYYALHELARPRPGQRILVHSAAGGVGSTLVQLGKAMGCQVLAVVGAPHKIEVARGLGADRVVDRSQQDLWREVERWAPGGIDAIFDANGVATLAESYRHLAPAGRLIVYGFHSMLDKGGAGRPNWLRLGWRWLRTPRFNPLDMTTRNRSVLAFNLSFLFDHKDIFDQAMAFLAAAVASGALAPATLTEYPLERVDQAHRDLESGQTIGKLVLSCGTP